MVAGLSRPPAIAFAEQGLAVFMPAGVAATGDGHRAATGPDPARAVFLRVVMFAWLLGVVVLAWRWPATVRGLSLHVCGTSPDGTRGFGSA